MNLQEFEGIEIIFVKQNKALEVPCHVVDSSFTFKEFTGI